MSAEAAYFFSDAHLGSDPAATLDEIWQVSCHAVDNGFYADHMRLMWPDTGITGR